MRVTLHLLLVLGLLCSQIIVGQQPSQANDDVAPSDVIIYQNVPEVTVSDVKTAESGRPQLELDALAIYTDGDVRLTETNLTWTSTNQNVATVDQNGRVTLTEQNGRTFITVTNGMHEDRIAIDYKVNAPNADKHKGKPNEAVQILKETGDRYDIVAKIRAQMTLEEKVGQMLMPDFRYWDGQAVVEVLPEIEEMIREYHVGGVILFRENVVSTPQIIELVNGYQAAAEKLGLLLAIDQEGGIVTRLQNGTDLPGNMALGATRSEDLAFQAGDVIGNELEVLGINMNLAPVVDVNNNPDNPVIGVRSFGEDPTLVGDMGVSYVHGLQQNGVAATLKHFPGHGDTAVDSHLGLPEVPHDKERLRDVELYPFQRAMDAGVDAIMTAHVTFPMIDDQKAISRKDGEEIAIPATLSYPVLTELMREEMGYQGVVMTDAMNMNAITDHFGSVDATIRAVKAGADIILMPVGLEEVFNGILDAVHEEEISEERINQSVERILALKLSRGILKSETFESTEEQIEQAEKVIGSEAHQAIEQNIADQSVTLLKNEGVLPLKPQTDENIVVIGQSFVSSLTEAVEEHHDNVSLIQLQSSQRTLTSEQEQLVQEADYMIVGSYTYNVAGRSPDHPHMQLFQQLQAMNKPMVGIAIRNPYDIMGYPHVNAYLAQYGFREASFKATADILFGEKSPTGQLPVTIPNLEGGVLYEYGEGLDFGE
ncbi:glycoside hydrolase family 3 N-terminal domain-containing protein [Caldalkalibacillus salinus]|uniref:glycoside hydrolase family 3 N-terminal domain-containing protein n=1 Tax=Caldalkalibacillus salinus TaxID=2803787 RepID=UPI001923308E|nr:glycoside hydrolase family 3 N-terminal domain-containing protein [Caldalkalibacillus salinus]